MSERVTIQELIRRSMAISGPTLTVWDRSMAEELIGMADHVMVDRYPQMRLRFEGQLPRWEIVMLLPW